MKNDHIYFIGIKGTGMAALAGICHDLGYIVSGSDLPDHFFTEEGLRKRGIPIYTFSAENVPTDAIVVKGNAFSNEHVEVKEAEKKNLKIYSYHEFLGKLIEPYRSIAVSGSHGKTTTSTMLRDMMAYSQKTAYLIGDGRGHVSEFDQYFVLEACEYRRHFLEYKPEMAIMTNFEIDHVDYFKSEEDYLRAYEDFSRNVKELLVVWGEDPHFSKLNLKTPRVWTYGFTKDMDISAQNVQRLRERSVFDVYFKGEKIHRFNLPIVGDHMILNALATIAIGLNENIDPHLIEAGLQGFEGAIRRFVVEEGQDNVYIDDYAHHPTEVDVTLKAVRQRYPDHQIVAVFKPHRSGRLQYFAKEFSESLSQADKVYLVPFSSIDDFDDGADVDVDYLVPHITGSEILEEDANAVKRLAQHSPCVYVFMSSKDIYHLLDELKRSFND